MADLSLADLIRAHPWRRSIFTTYALSLTFFEVVVLDELIRAGAREALGLADVEGVRGAVSELGARRVGRDYQVEAVAVSRGVFHPKVIVLSSNEETHLVVGSGNLTFGGWGGNLETFDHLPTQRSYQKPHWDRKAVTGWRCAGATVWLSHYSFRATICEPHCGAA